MRARKTSSSTRVPGVAETTLFLSRAIFVLSFERPHSAHNSTQQCHASPTPFFRYSDRDRQGKDPWGALATIARDGSGLGSKPRNHSGGSRSWRTLYPGRRTRDPGVQGSSALASPIHDARGTAGSEREDFVKAYTSPAPRPSLLPALDVGLARSLTDPLLVDAAPGDVYHLRNHHRIRSRLAHPPKPCSHPWQASRLLHPTCASKRVGQMEGVPGRRSRAGAIALDVVCGAGGKCGRGHHCFSLNLRTLASTASGVVSVAFDIIISFEIITSPG